MWACYFQADGEMRHLIAVRRFIWSAEHERLKFIERMTHPEIGLWWTWTEPFVGEEETNDLPS